jgi:hypothetical protein
VPLIPPVDCDEPEAPEGCTGLFEMGEVILDAGLAALAPYEVEGGCGGSLDGYVSMGEPTPGCCDVLAVHLLSYSPGALDLLANPGAQQNLYRWEAAWKIDLFEGCYPLDVGVTQPVGIPLTTLHEWGRHSHAHGLAVFQAVWDAWVEGPLRPCDQLLFGELVPIQPSGTCAGWSFTVTGDVP